MRFFCLNIPHFPVWAIAQSQSALTDKPFVVCEGGSVIAPSPLAIEAGITVGMTSARAQSFCPSLVILGRDRHCEHLAWAEVQRTFYGLTPKIESPRPGLLFADLDQSKALSLLKRWQAKGGVADNRATAHLAALEAPAGYARIVKSSRERDFIGNTPITLLEQAGLNRKSVQKLGYFGWKRIGQLSQLSRRQLEEQLGLEGIIAYGFAQGARWNQNLLPIARWNPPEELFASLEFEVAAREPAHWDGAIDELLEELCEYLGTKQAQTLEVTAHTPVAPVMARRILKEPLSNARTMRRIAQSALQSALEALLPLPPVILKLEIVLGGLTTAPVQETLFEDESAEKGKRLSSALRHLENRMPNHIGRYIEAESDSPFMEDRHRWSPTDPATPLGSRIPPQKSTPQPTTTQPTQSTTTRLRAILLQKPTNNKLPRQGTR